MNTYKLTTRGSVLRLSDNASIPPDPANTDYAEYLAWVEAGGVPDPVDPPDPRDAILAQIAALEALETKRRIAEAMPDDAGGTAAGRAWLAVNRAEIAALRAGL